MSISLILLGAGESSRFKLPVKKQWLRVKDEPLWLYVANRFQEFGEFEKIVIVSSQDEINYMKRFGEFTFVKGGSSRQQSLKNALSHIESEYVITSDIARVCIDKNVLNDLICAKDRADVIVPAIGVVDTVHNESGVVQRESLKRIQTPQLSSTKVLKKALNTDEEFTDDSSAIMSIGGKVEYIKGYESQKKLTTTQDLQTLPCIKPPTSDFFVGNGFDVHAFGEQRELILGGIKVHESMGLKAHSDGDVVIHALIDSLLGAIGYYDIGEMFPDSDERYKNANSYELLQKVVEFLHKVGYVVVNCDITILCQSPKLAPFKDEMAKHLSKALHIKPFYVNVKATTTERLGFVGRQEGIATQVSSLVKFYNWMENECIDR